MKRIWKCPICLNDNPDTDDNNWFVTCKCGFKMPRRWGGFILVEENDDNGKHNDS